MSHQSGVSDVVPEILSKMWKTKYLFLTSDTQTKPSVLLRVLEENVSKPLRSFYILEKKTCDESLSLLIKIIYL